MHPYAAALLKPVAHVKQQRLVLVRLFTLTRIIIVNANPNLNPDPNPKPNPNPDLNSNPNLSPNLNFSG